MYNDLVMNTMHMFNEKAKLRGYTNGIAWAKAAFEAGELTDNELIILAALHEGRNKMAHGQAGKFSHTEEDYQFLLNILSKFDKSQLRADGDTWEEHATERATPEEIEAWFRQGKECYNGMQYEEAVKYYRKAAAQGHYGAQNNLAVCYALGQGVPKDDGKAMQWYRKSAEQGNPVALDNLGVRYLYGSGAEKDWSKAVSLFQKAAEQGFANAQYNLAECYYWGKGIKKDDKEAFRWYEKAAEQGNAGAMGRLGDCYYDGIGVAQNYEKAFSWYQKGAEKKDSTSLNGLGNCYYYGHGVEKNSGTAEGYYEKAANDGNPFAQLHLVHIKQAYYDNNNQYKWYKEEADKWNAGAKRAFEARLQNGSAEEYYAYACYLYYARHDDCCDPHACYRWGERNERNWIEKAAEMGQVDALTIVGAKLVEYQWVDKSLPDEWQNRKNNEQKGRKMLYAAATQGSTEAMSHLGVNYIESQTLETNPTEGGKWLLKAEMRGYSVPASVASYLDQFLEGHMTPALVKELLEYSGQGYAGASRYLSLCYENGYGVAKDEQEARRYLQLAADQGDSEAQRLLAATSSKNEEAVAAAKELDKLIKAAKRGDLEAQYKLACCYAKGEGVEKNEKEAFKWYKKAADQFVPDCETRYLAAYEVVRCYEHGIGVEKDAKEMVSYCWNATGSKTLPDEQKADIRYKIGYDYVSTKIVVKPYTAAKPYYEYAASLGHEQAKQELFEVRIKSTLEKLFNVKFK